MTHTPGPWEYSGGGIWGKSPLNARVRLADITFHNSINAIDSEANARAMAATPELLAALLPFAGLPELAPYETEVPNDSQVTIHCHLGDVRRALAAIAKATGRDA